MSWGAIDDGMVDHEKWRALEKNRREWADCLALWMCVFCYSNRVGSDGFIDFDRLARISCFGSRAKSIAKRLHEVGLIDLEDDGFRLHDYLEYNPSKERRDARKALKKKRDSRYRTGKTGKRDASHGASKRASNVAPPGDATNVAPLDASDVASNVADPLPHPQPKREGARVEPEIEEAAVDALRELSGRQPRDRSLVNDIFLGTGKAFEAHSVPRPKQLKDPLWAGWVDIASWCEAKAALIEDLPIEVAKVLVRRFLKNERARSKGYPLTFLAANPEEYWAAA